MGIDIREGLQYECIACGLCIDACNDVMDKVGLPRGLIRYDTTVNQELRDAGKKTPSVWSHILRLRTFYYIAIMALVGGIMLYSLLTRSPLELHVIHDRNPLFVTLSNGDIRNGYDVKILNKTHEDRIYQLRIEGIENAEIRMQGVASQHNPNQLAVFADSVGHFRLFVAAPKQEESREKLTFIIEDTLTGGQDDIDSLFISKSK